MRTGQLGISMERKEPTFSTPELSDIEFRRPRLTSRPHTESYLMWKVAAGVFIGMSLCMLATCSFIGIGADALIEEQEKAQKAAVEKFIADASDPDPFGFAARQEAERRREIERRTLKPGQRCIQGKRLERIEGGWRDIPNEPC